MVRSTSPGSPTNVSRHPPISVDENGRHHVPKQLRTSTYIEPRTGESRRNPFFLRRPSEFSPSIGENLDENVNFDTPWFATSTLHPVLVSSLHYVRLKSQIATKPVVKFMFSPLGQDVFKCSLAYLLASLPTLVPAIGTILGKGDGKHVVATVTVYFHPARAAGSMVEAIGLASLAFLYALAVTATSSAVSALFGQNGLLYIGYAIVLLLFCGGGLGFIGWVKHKFQDPLINVACSLASLAIITILTKEGHVQSAVFSIDKMMQVLRMIVLGVTFSALVCFFINPIYARYEMRKHLVHATDALESTLSIITDDFSRGFSNDVSHKALTTARKRFKTALTSLKKYQNEARYEHYVLGTVREHKLYGYLIDSIETLGQDLGGLRSASKILIELVHQKIEDSTHERNPVDSSSRPIAISRTPSANSLQSLVHLSASPLSVPNPLHLTTHHTFSIDDVIASPATISQESPASGSFLGNPGAHALSSLQIQKAITSALPASSDAHESESSSAGNPQLPSSDIFLIPNSSDHALVFGFFISNLGPSVQSLAYTMKLILQDLPCGPAPDYTVVVDRTLRDSLGRALELFIKARSKAFSQLRQHKIDPKSRTIEAVADYEEVAAGCGHFSSSLEDFAEDLKLFIDVLSRITTVMNGQEPKSWDWLKFWRFNGIAMSDDDDLAARLIVPSTKPWKSKPSQMPSKKTSKLRYKSTDGPLAMKFAMIRYRVWQALSLFRRDDIKYAFKVGIGAIMYAVWSFVPATRPIYAHFRGEWGLVSYMLVCSMMVGASNTTALFRILGTCSGAILAVGVWILADENPFLLAIFGWIASFACFYLILGMNQGPVGRYVLLTYNLSALYAYSLTIQDQDDGDDDEIELAKAAIVEIVFHRVTSVIVGCLWGIVITRLLWPIQARRKLRDGIAVLWLRVSMMWQPDPLDALLSPYRIGGESTNLVAPVSLSLTESIRLQRHLDRLQTIRTAACNEITLKGPFRNDIYSNILERTGRVVHAIYALNVLLTARRRPPTTDGEKRLLHYTANERSQLSTRIGHLFSVLASSILLGYPSLSSAMPKIGSSRDKLLARLYTFRYNKNNSSTELDRAGNTQDADYEMFYAYSLITGQLGTDLEEITRDLDELFGELDEETVVLWD